MVQSLSLFQIELTLSFLDLQEVEASGDILDLFSVLDD
jgi:hypothetical protein